MSDLELMGIAEIAASFDVDRRTVHYFIDEHEDFPAPIAELAQGKVWAGRDIRAWREKHPGRRKRS